jgi:hypothetical protein
MHESPTIPPDPRSAVRQLAADYVGWVLDFEGRCIASGRPASRYFHAPGLELYTRWSRSKVATQGRPTIVLANIEVHEPLRGLGLFSEIIKRLSAPTCALRAEALYVELVGEKRLAAWLQNNGFHRCPIAEEGAPSFFRFRPVRNGEVQAPDIAEGDLALDAMRAGSRQG